MRRGGRRRGGACDSWISHGAAVRAEDRSPVIDLSSGNAEMNAAIAKGRATLPTFWASYDAPKPSETGHSLKGTVSRSEEQWRAHLDGRCEENRRRPLFGRFANAPRDLPGKKAGEVALFTEADISDWMFMRNGKIVGGETIRPLLKSLPKADADALRARTGNLKETEGQCGESSPAMTGVWCWPCDTVARPGLGWYQRAPWLKNPRNPRNSAHACRAGWKIVARRRLPPRARWSRKSAKSTSATALSRWKRPAMEFTDALGKFLPDQDRPNEGVFSFQDDDEQWISLRYDLTAPLARYVAENFDALPKPYRSYRAGYVYRNEKPGPGRFRQFMQFDADTVGSASPAADAEMCMMAADTMEALGIPRGSYVVKVNNRKVLDGVRDALGIADDGQWLTVMRAIDKLDRLGISGVQQLARRRPQGRVG